MIEAFKRIDAPRVRSQARDVLQHRHELEVPDRTGERGHLCIVIPVVLVTMTSHPDNFLGAGRYGAFLFWAPSIFGPLLVPILQTTRVWSVAAPLWLGIHSALAVCCFTLSQGFNFRALIGAKLKGEEVNWRKVFSERELAYRGLTFKGNKAVRVDEDVS